MPNCKMPLVLCLTLFVGATFAAPAAWFYWRSKLDSVLLCSQTTPGDGWEKFSGPFLDARCERLKTVARALTAQRK